MSVIWWFDGIGFGLHQHWIIRWRKRREKESFDKKKRWWNESDFASLVFLVHHECTHVWCMKKNRSIHQSNPPSFTLFQPSLNTPWHEAIMQLSPPLSLVTVWLARCQLVHWQKPTKLIVIKNVVGYFITLLLRDCGWQAPRWFTDTKHMKTHSSKKFYYFCMIFLSVFFSILKKRVFVQSKKRGLTWLFSFFAFAIVWTWDDVGRGRERTYTKEGWVVQLGLLPQIYICVEWNYLGDSIAESYFRATIDNACASQHHTVSQDPFSRKEHPLPVQDSDNNEKYERRPFFWRHQWTAEHRQHICQWHSESWWTTFPTRAKHYRACHDMQAWHIVSCKSAPPLW